MATMATVGPNIWSGLARAGLSKLGIEPPEWAGAMDAPLPARFYDRQKYYRPGLSRTPQERNELDWMDPFQNASFPQVASSDNGFVPQSGFHIVDVSGQNNLVSRLNLRPLDPVQGFVVHHTGPGMKTVDDVVNVFKQRGFPAQFVVDPNGTVYQTLPTGYEGQQIAKTSKYKAVAATGLKNLNTIGVEVMADDDGKINPAEIEAVKGLYNYVANDPAAAGWKATGLPASAVFSHGVLNPGDKMPNEGLTITNAIRAAYGAPTYDFGSFQKDPLSFMDRDFMARQDAAVFNLPAMPKTSAEAAQQMATGTIDKARDAAIRTAYAEDTRSPEGPLSVIYNRTQDKRFPADAFDVVSQPSQFNAYGNELYKSLKPTDGIYQDLGKTWDALVAGTARPVTPAIGFVNNKIAAIQPWQKTMTYQGEIGGHKFYGEVIPKTPGAPPPASMATLPPDMVAKPISATDVPAGPLGSDSVIKAGIEGDKAGIAEGWNKLVNEVMSGGAAAQKQIAEFNARPDVIPFARAAAGEMAFHPDLATAIPERVGAIPLISSGYPLRENIQAGANELLGFTGRRMAEQAGIFPTVTPSLDTTNARAVEMFAPEGSPHVGPITADSIAHEMGVGFTNIDTLRKQAADAQSARYAYTSQADAAGVTHGAAPPVTGQGEVPQEKTWQSVGGAGVAPKVAETKPEFGSVGGAGVAPSMATVQPPGSGLTESMDYALHISPSIEAAINGTLTPQTPATAPMAYQATGGAGAAPKPSMATKPPGGGGIGGRIYRAVAQPIQPGSSSFWSGPMHQPNFTSLGGGSTMPYQPNTGRTQTDQWGNKVNVGVYTDSQGNQHEYTWSPSGAP